MFRSNSKNYDEIRQYLDEVPVIETHEHYTGVVKPVEDILSFLLNTYYKTDFISSSFGMEKDAYSIFTDDSYPSNLRLESLSFEERFEIFKKLYKKSDKTAYAKCIQTGLKKCWGIDRIDDPEALKELEKRFSGRNQEFYERTMNACGIRAKVVDIFDIKPYVEGKISNYSKYCRFAFPLPQYHNIHSKLGVNCLEQYAGHRITCLDEYIEGFENLLKKALDFGVVCMKDQSAYRRQINYSNPSRGEAERIFNNLVSKPRDIFGDDEVRLLDDWLFNHFMRLARKYDLPVQLHTGYLAGLRNDVQKANAVHLTPLLELHQDVRFALFHGNWPYMDDILFIGKNYPNVWLDLCWVQSVDPVYCVELMKRILLVVPHAKVFAFGADTFQIEWVVGYLELARDNVACALSEMVDSGWIDMHEAKEIAADWFFNNPNEFYRLGFERFTS